MTTCTKYPLKAMHCGKVTYLLWVYPTELYLKEDGMGQIDLIQNTDVCLRNMLETGFKSYYINVQQGCILDVDASSRRKIDNLLFSFSGIKLAGLEKKQANQEAPCREILGF